MTDILMPALSPTMEEGALTKWNVKVGDTVSAGDVIAEIETDKATMEVEAVDEGVVEAILIPAGTENVKVNAPIARLSGGEAAPAPAPKAETPAAAAAPSTASRSPSPASGGGHEAVKPVSSSAKAGEGDQAKPGGGGAVPAKGSGQRIFASPLARRLAAQAGIDLAALTGSGPHGRIVKADVEKAPKGQAAPVAAASASAPREAKSLAQLGIPDGSYDLIPLDNVRKVIARRLTEAARDIPHFPLTVDCEIDNLLAARTRINAILEKEGVKVSVNDLVIKAAAMALMRVPGANASYTEHGIAMHHDADVAMAVAYEGGLITPIIRKAQTKGLAQIAKETKDLAARARDKKLKPEEFQGGTFSVSNLGMFGIKTFSSIINEPQGAIMSVGAGEPRPVVRAGQLAIATVMSVTVTCDHRVVDGATGAQFISVFKAMIEDPAAMLV